MLGYLSHWTAGFDYCQWKYLFTKHNVTEWTLIHISAERDRVCQSWGVEIHLVGFRFWFCF